MIKDYLLTPFQKFIKMESFSGILVGSLVSGIAGAVILKLAGAKRAA